MAKWDNAKFILMCFVVLGHFINYTDFQSTLLRWLWVFIYLFHMPAFLFLSGLFSKKTIDERRFDKMLPYLFLYFTMEILQFIVFSIVNGTPFSFSLFADAGVPWYALVLFWCYLATSFIKSFRPGYTLAFAIALGILAGYSNLGDFLSGMRFFTFFPFFLAGYYIPVEKFSDWLKKKTVRIGAGACLLAGLLLCFLYKDRLYALRDFLKGRSSYAASMELLPYGGIYRGLYYAAAFILVISFIAVMPDVKCRISMWGQRTVQVLVLHYPVLYVLMNTFHLLDFLKKLWPAHYGWLVLPFVFGLTVICSWKVWTPFFEWLMNPLRRDTGTDLTDSEREKSNA